MPMRYREIETEKTQGLSKAQGPVFNSTLHIAAQNKAFLSLIVHLRSSGGHDLVVGLVEASPRALCHDFLVALRAALLELLEDEEADSRIAAVLVAGGLVEVLVQLVDELLVGDGRTRV
jgi:hypothetical protein